MMTIKEIFWFILRRFVLGLAVAFILTVLSFSISLFVGGVYNVVITLAIFLPSLFLLILESSPFQDPTHSVSMVLLLILLQLIYFYLLSYLATFLSYLYKKLKG